MPPPDLDSDQGGEPPPGQRYRNLGIDTLEVVLLPDLRRPTPRGRIDITSRTPVDQPRRTTRRPRQIRQRQRVNLRRLTPTRCMTAYARSLRLVGEPPRQWGSNARTSVATTAQVWALYDAISQQARKGILLGAFAGFRFAEAVVFQPEHLDVESLMVDPTIQYPADEDLAHCRPDPRRAIETLALGGGGGNTVRARRLRATSNPTPLRGDGTVRAHCGLRSA